MDRSELLSKAEEKAIDQVRESAALGDIEYESLKMLPEDLAVKTHAKKILVDAGYDIDIED